MKSTIVKPWDTLVDVWRSGQIALPQVQRWSKYVHDTETNGTRSQDALQHSYSLVTLGIIFLRLMRPYLEGLDAELVLTALHVHDHGEGELGVDTCYIDKTEEGDLNEYLAFLKRYSRLSDAGTFDHFHRAFLLQFARKNPKSFPPFARAAMKNLRQNYPQEMLAFEALERWDCLLFPLEQFAERGNAKVLVQVLRNQLPHLDRLAQELKGFGIVIWTPAIRAACVDFLDAHEGEWIERPKKEGVVP